MNIFELRPGLSEQICLTLFHSLWQVSLLAAIAHLLYRRLKRHSIHASYVIHVGSLLIALLATPVTWLMLPSSANDSTAAVEAMESPAIQQESHLLSDTTHQAGIEHVSAGHSTPITSVSGSGAPDPGQRRSPNDASLTPTSTGSETQAVTGSSFGDNVPFRWAGIAAWIVAAYAAGVLLMVIRLALATVRASRLRFLATRIHDGPLVIAVKNQARRWSMRLVPAISHAETIVVPRVTGILRPVILLPTAIVAQMNPDDLQLILMHELAHVRRLDLWINLLQRLAETLLFFNPALWYLSRRISILREYCCDEMTCSAPNGQPESDGTTASTADEMAGIRVRYASALLQIAEAGLAQRTVDLTALSATGSSPSELRRRIAWLFGEPCADPGLTRGGLLAIVMGAMAFLCLPVLQPPLTAALSSRSDSKPISQQSTQSPADTADSSDTSPKAAKSQRSFRLHVTDQQGVVVPNVEVEFRTRPEVKAEHVTTGEFLRRGAYGSFVRTTDQGMLQLDVPPGSTSFHFFIRTAGFGPYTGRWDHPDINLPDDFTAGLERGWSVGGVIVDENGAPVPDVSVRPSIQFRNGGEVTSQLGSGAVVTTDADGKWQFDSVPDSRDRVFVELHHAKFSAGGAGLSREEYEVKPGAQPGQKITLNKGLTVTGTITDTDGKPIPDALVRTKFLNDLREARTDANGVYHLTGCLPQVARIVVSATGKAIDLKEVAVDPGMPPVDFVMQPGGHVRVRVVDEKGNGIPKSRIFLQRWKGHVSYFEFNHINMYTDANGVWQWDEAPLDEFAADICRPDGMQLEYQPLFSTDREFVFSPPKPLVVTGRVVDATTEKSIAAFKVTPGERRADSGQDLTTDLNWDRQDAFNAKDGTFQVKFTRSAVGHLVRIEASGYQVAVSRDFKTDEGNVTFNFELTPAENIAATILSDAGEPAADAQIAVADATSQISIRNGEFDSQTYATVLKTDQRGQFSMPAQTEPFHLIVLHRTGFAHLISDEGAVPQSIKLTPWARAEGIYRIGSTPATNITVELSGSGLHAYGPGQPSIFTRTDTKTDGNGRFHFDRVFPGRGRIGRQIVYMVKDGATEVTSAKHVPAEFPAGETTPLNVGGDGRLLTSSLKAPEKQQSPVHWSEARIQVQPAVDAPPLPEPPQNVAKDNAALEKWYEQWIQSEVGKAWQAATHAAETQRAALPIYAASVDRDGVFQISDIPPGQYSMDVHLEGTSGIRGHRFTIPDDAGETFELPPLQLEQ
ncbi:MAG: carboxypeptidase regulatory-like domain-containing protein [Planctomycetaceae bacterium]|nr:carboxypeptidase regulatory-like domain-containing protein [Planctomycetaceae bacterium]